MSRSSSDKEVFDMSYRKPLLKAGILATLALTMVTGIAAAKIGTVTVTSGSLRLRSEASTASATLAYVPNRTQVEVLEMLDGWYKVDYAGTVGYMSSSYLSLNPDTPAPEAAPTPDEAGDVDGEEGTYVRVAIRSGWLNVRSGPGTTHSRVGTMKDGSVATVISQTDGWFQITDGEVTGYVSGDYVELITEEEAIAAGDPSISALPTPGSPSASGQSVVDFAMQYKGRPYVYGAAGPNSFDCSGFTMYVFKHYGYSLPHTATGQLSYGEKVSRGELQPGDLVFFRDPSITSKAASHVGIYIGDGQFIHGSSSKNNGKCVAISSLSSNYYNKYFTTGRRLVQ